MVSHAGSALLAWSADRLGLTKALSEGLAPMRERRSPHDPGRVVRDLCVMLTDGGDALSDLGAVREQAPLFGAVASDSTAWRTIARIASDPELREALRAARKTARERAWDAGAKPSEITIDLDATLIGAHSEKQGAAGNFKGGFGFHPMLAYLDESEEALAGELREETRARTPPPTRSRLPRRRSSSSPRRSPPRPRSSCGSTPPAPPTSSSIGLARGGSATRSAST